MALFLEITDGPEKGQKYPLKAGLQIGRSQGDIILSDVKASGLHAEVEEDQKGQLILIDKDSFNGLRINGNKVKRIALLPGVTFQIGKTLFKVLKLYGHETPDPQNEAPINSREKLLQALDKLQIPANTYSVTVTPFAHPIELHFIEGIQAESVITLGYGPRTIGSDCMDVEIEEPISPAVAFEINNKDSEVIFKTDYSSLVMINGLPSSVHILNSGDRISIGTTLIEVRFRT